MKKKTKQVLCILKPKCKALGFNLEELEGVAADIADNLELDEEASEEEINEKISNEIDTVIPYLKIAQKASNRVIQNSKSQIHENENPEKEGSKEKIDEEIPAWAQSIVTQNKAILTELAGFKSERVSDNRRSRLKVLLKDTGTYGKSVLKNFDRMKFENDTEFDEFFNGVTEDLATLNQERANAGLAKLGATSATSGTEKEDKEDKPKVMSDEEVEDLASTM
jgi:hypothetical protein